MIEEQRRNTVLRQAFLCVLWLAVISVFCFLFISIGAAYKVEAGGDSMLRAKLHAAAAKVRHGETSTLRTESAEHLADLTRGIEPSEVDDTTLADMVSLLDTEEDSVRYWVATALGNLGPRAKTAAPRLIRLLPKVDCLRGEKTSASAIRSALKRMGETPPPIPNCGAKK